MVCCYLFLIFCFVLRLVPSLVPLPSLNNLARQFNFYLLTRFAKLDFAFFFSDSKSHHVALAVPAPILNRQPQRPVQITV
jgi:hypothetical protein